MGKHVPDSTRNTKHCRSSKSQPLRLFRALLRLVQSWISTAIPQQVNTQASYILGCSQTPAVLLTHSHSNKHHLDTLTLSESFPLSSYFTKHCIYVETAGTKAIWVCWGSMHIQQLYTWKGPLPTLQLQDNFLSFVTGTRSALKKEFSKFTQALSGRKHEPDNAQPCH